MKKTLLATAIAGALGASAAAQAAVVYDQDGTKLDIYGRIAVGIEGGGPQETRVNEDTGVEEVEDNGPEVINVFSRLRFTASHQINSDLRGFARVEFRFAGDERTGPSINGQDAFSEVRHSYLGLESASFGTVQLGNYDGYYGTYVAGPFDVYLVNGLNLTGPGTQDRGDSIGYVTPDLSGFKAFITAKHYSERDEIPSEIEANGDSEIVTQGGAMYEAGPLRLALGYIDDEEGRAGGTGEMIYGATAAYALTDAFSARLGYETQDEADDNTGGYNTVGLGMTYSMGQWAFNADVYNVDNDNSDDRTAWATGAYYKVSNNFDVFAELYQGDQPDITISTGDGVDVADGDDVYYVTGARYHF